MRASLVDLGCQTTPTLRTFWNVLADSSDPTPVPTCGLQGTQTPLKLCLCRGDVSSGSFWPQGATPASVGVGTAVPPKELAP